MERFTNTEEAVMGRFDHLTPQERVELLERIDHPGPCRSNDAHAPHGTCPGTAPEFPSEPVRVPGDSMINCAACGTRHHPLGDCDADYSEADPGDWDAELFADAAADTARLGL